MHDVIIIGSDAASMSAAVYCVKSKLDCLVIFNDSQNEPTEMDDGFFNIKNLKSEFQDLVNDKLLKVETKQKIVSLDKNIVSFSIETNTGATYYARSIIITSDKTDFDLLTNKNTQGKIKTDSLARTNIVGIFAAGSATISDNFDVLISAGEGAKAVLSVIDFLKL